MKVKRFDTSGLNTAQKADAAKKTKNTKTPSRAVRYTDSNGESAVGYTASGTTAQTAKSTAKTYAETMSDYYAGIYAAALAENARTAESAAANARSETESALSRLRSAYGASDRELYRDYMEQSRTLPQKLAAQGITGGMTESSNIRLASAYGEAAAENARARISEEETLYAALAQSLARAESEKAASDSAARSERDEKLASLRQEAEKNRAETAALLAAAGDYSGYLSLGLTSEQADYLSQVWAAKNPSAAPLVQNRRSRANNTASDTLAMVLLTRAQSGEEAAVSCLAAQLAAGAIDSSEAAEIWNILRAA